MTPEQAREAARKIIAVCPVELSAGDSYAMETDIANALIAASPGVEVRPLEWHQVNGFWGLIWQADDRFDHVYSIFRWKDGTFAWSFASQSRPCESVDEAKAASDMHYRARIGLALRTAGGGG